MRACYSSRSLYRCKTRTDDTPEFRPADEDLPTRRSAPLTPDEKDRRVAALRHALQGAAPEFHYRARLERGGKPQ